MKLQCDRRPSQAWNERVRGPLSCVQADDQERTAVPTDERRIFALEVRENPGHPAGCFDGLTDLIEQRPAVASDGRRHAGHAQQRQFSKRRVELLAQDPDDAGRIAAFQTGCRVESFVGLVGERKRRNPNDEPERNNGTPPTSR